MWLLGIVILILLVALSRENQLLVTFFNYLDEQLPGLVTNNQQSLCQPQKQSIHYTTLASTVSECLWIRNMLDEIQILNLAISTLIYEDNQSCITITKEPRKHKRLKDIDVKYCFVKEACDNGNIQIKYIPTTNHIRDYL
jgi:hypothetical protein